MTEDFQIPGKKSIWNGFEKYDFELDGINCIIVKPNNIKDGNPWLWRARFFDAFPDLDIAVLKKGWWVVHIDVTDLYGSAETMRRFDLFYKFLVDKFDFAPKAVLEGFSRGGLAVFNWACLRPEKVACVYADNPVCDFKSWPGGKGEGPGAPDDWQKCLNAYGLSESEAMEYDQNPVDKTDILIENRIPVIFVYGDADEVVPIPENTAIMLEKLKKSDAEVKSICKPGELHHPHCLKDPTPIIEFIEKYV